MQRGISTLSQHNDANVLVLGIDSIGRKLSGEIAMIYLTASFDNEVKNQHRIGMMHEYESETKSLKVNKS